MINVLSVLFLAGLENGSCQTFLKSITQRERERGGGGGDKSSLSNDHFTKTVRDHRTNLAACRLSASSFDRRVAKRAALP